MDSPLCYCGKGNGNPLNFTSKGKNNYGSKGMSVGSLQSNMFNNKGKGKSEQPSKGGKSNKPKPSNLARCDMCKEVGHYIKNCPNKGKFASTKCANCKGTGHPASACSSAKKS